jgi:hypothetical protein
MERTMKKVKTGIWVLIVAFVAIFIYQNRQFFMAGQSLRLDLAFTEYQSPEWKIVMICAGFFVAGLILGIYLLIIYHLRSKRKRKVQQQQTTADKPAEQISTGEPAAKPVPNLPRGSDTETVVISPEVAPPVAERQEQ